jgi:hypothetical protein
MLLLLVFSHNILGKTNFLCIVFLFIKRVVWRKAVSVTLIKTSVPPKKKKKKEKKRKKVVCSKRKLLLPTKTSLYMKRYFSFQGNRELNCMGNLLNLRKLESISLFSLVYCFPCSPSLGWRSQNCQHLKCVIIKKAQGYDAFVIKLSLFFGILLNQYIL